MTHTTGYFRWLTDLLSWSLGKHLAADADAYFNRKIPPDVLGVLDAASQLDTTEFDIFRGAYHEWFGRDPSDRDIEPDFARYMYAEVAPHWVRSYTRRVRESAARGAVDPEKFGIRRAPVQELDIRRGRIYILLLGLSLLILFLLAIGSDEDLLAGMRGCILPPCY